MRNLKRALSLALASVMLVGLMVVGTGASYSDVSSKSNLEAIEVLQAVGIMTGDDKGNFNPDQKVTRNEMAVVMTNLMDYKIANYTGATPFSDVPTWAEPYVAACYTNKIIAGTSATTYGGSASVTTAQAALMIMKALDYFQYSSDFGDDWQLATVRQGNKIDLFDDVDTGVTEAMTRNDVAQLVLNALQANKAEVTVSGNSTNISTGDVTVNIGVTATYTATGEMLMEDLYDGDLDKTTSSDVMGRPATKWSYNDDEIGTYGQSADKTYAIDDADMSIAAVLTDGDYFDYDSTKANAANATIKVNGDAADDTDKLQKGDVISVFLNDDEDKVLYVTVARYQAAIIDEIDTDISDDQEDDGVNAIVTLKDIDDGDLGDFYDTIKASASASEKDKLLNGFVGTTYKEGAALAVAFNNAGEVVDSYAIKAVTGEPASAREAEYVTAGNSSTPVTKGYITIGSTKYNFAGTVAGTVKDFDFDAEYSVYATAEGYVMAIDGVSDVTLDDVYYVSGVYKVDSNYGKDSWYAQAVLLSDGTVKDIKIDSDFVSATNNAGFDSLADMLATLGGATNPTYLMLADGTLKGTSAGSATAIAKTLYVTQDYLYTFDDDGVPSVWDDSDYDVVNEVTIASDIKKTDSTITINSTKYYVDNATKYVGVEDVGDDIDVTAVAGGMSADTSTDALVIADGRDAKYVVYVAATLTGAQSDDVVYVTEKPTEKNSDGWVATVYFMEDNTSKTITMEDQEVAGFYTYDIDSDGVYDLAAASSDVITTATAANDSDTEGWISGLAITSRGSTMLTGTFNTNQIATDVEFGAAKVMDDDDDAHSAIYNREINTVSRLQSAIDAATTVTADIYMVDGEITFIYVTSLA